MWLVQLKLFCCTSEKAGYNDIVQLCYQADPALMQCVVILIESHNFQSIL